jgi:hypothetical protein
VYTVTSRLTMSPSSRGRVSGMPWQMTCGRADSAVMQGQLS